MKTMGIVWLSVVTVAGVGAVGGCRPKVEPESAKPAGVIKRTGAVLELAAESTVEVGTNVAAKTLEVAKDVGTATKDATGQVVEKAGEGLDKAGAAVEKVGADLQK
jgi:hypothetical protein